MKHTEAQISEIIALAWCDKTSFEDIQMMTQLSETEVIKIMRNNLKPSRFRRWRMRVTGRDALHKKKNAILKQDLYRNINALHKSKRLKKEIHTQ